MQPPTHGAHNSDNECLSLKKKKKERYTRARQETYSEMQPLGLAPFPSCFQKNQGDHSPASRIRGLCSSWPKHTTVQFKMPPYCQMCRYTPAILGIKRLRRGRECSRAQGHVVKPLKMFFKNLIKTLNNKMLLCISDLGLPPA